MTSDNTPKQNSPVGEPARQVPAGQADKSLHGNGFLGWLGRQVGYVRRAIHADVSPPAEKTIYRDTKIEEQPLPEDARVKLRRTVIDEIVVKDGKPDDKK